MVQEGVRALDRSSTSTQGPLYLQIFDTIREWIREGRLKEGDMLPSERDLAQMFDVSRVPVREVLKVLEFAGVAEQVRGKGVFIKRISAHNLISNLDFVMMDRGHTLLEMFEAREGIEVQAAALAAKRRTDEDLKAMETAIESMEQAMKTGGSLMDTSTGFHTALIAAAHNRAIQEINLFISDWLRLARTAVYRHTSLHDVGLQHHKNILEAIRRQDSEEAERMMKAHLDRSRKVIEDAIAEATATGEIA